MTHPIAYFVPEGARLLSEQEEAELRVLARLHGRQGVLLSLTPAQRRALAQLAEPDDAETVGRVPEARRSSAR